MVYLSVPQSRASAGNTALDPVSVNGGTTIAEEKLIFDEITGLDEKPVRFGEKTFALWWKVKRQPAYSCFPLHVSFRDGMGHYTIYDEKFSPPAMRMSASSRLLTLTGQLIERSWNKKIRHSLDALRDSTNRPPAYRRNRSRASGFCMR